MDLLPGYNNDADFYQRPHQPLWTDADGGGPYQVGPEEVGVLDGKAKVQDQVPILPNTIFPILHTFVRFSHRSVNFYTTL
jgi:hypothetical protein